MPTVGQGSSDWGIPQAGQGDSRAGVVGAAGQATGSRPQPGVNAHPSGRVLVLLLPKQLHLWSSSNPRCAAQRGLSQSMERCPSDKPCSELVSRRAPHAAPASICPSPLHPVHPHPITPSGNGVTCRSFHRPGRPQPRTPIHFTMILFLAISGSAGAPPALRPPVRPRGCRSWWP